MNEKHRCEFAPADLVPDIWLGVHDADVGLEAIDSIKIVQVDGLTQRAGGNGNGTGVPGGGTGNLAHDAVAAALAYRAQAPVIDGLMKELGLDGSSLDALVASPAADAGAAPRPAVEAPPAPNGKPKIAAAAEDPDGEAETEAAG